MSSHSISDVLTKFEALLCQFEEEDIQHEDTAMEFSDLYLMAQEYYSFLDYPHQLNLMDMFVRSSCFIRF
ncbi:uncharacterized protein PG986_014422 [Apiospora aurea]|uniref:Uncharacterized protein n=1 Tax=Apiospora aurea TaxID=335848 RepID=A0ABR1PTX9_9PEZI